MVYLMRVTKTNGIAVGIHTLSYKEAGVPHLILDASLTLLSSDVAVEPLLGPVEYATHQLLKGSSSEGNRILNLLRLRVR